MFTLRNFSVSLRVPWRTSRALPTTAHCFCTKSESNVQSRVDGALATVTLDRPKKLNSLNMQMILDLTALYREWLHQESGVRCIVMDGVGRAFCAGGDVAAVRQASIDGSPLSKDFFYEEYLLNNTIATMFSQHGIPQVALWDGITMGGGVGLSVHGKFRVATENTLFAKPETAIGLFPDVGGTHVLGRVNGGLPVGLYIGLTGARLGAADCLEAGLATHYCPSESLPALRQALFDLGDAVGDAAAVDATINSVASGAAPDASKAVLAGNAPVIQSCFGKSTAEEIFRALEDAATGDSPGAQFARKTLSTLQKMSPTSIKVTIEAARRHAAADVTISDALIMEYRLSQRCTKPISDFCEGVRAVLVDKDNAPSWVPADLAGVSDDLVAGFFQPLSESHPRGELLIVR